MNLPDGNDLEARLEALLSAQADALIADTPFEAHFDQVGIPPAHSAQARSLLQLADRLHGALVSAEPSAEFVGRLKNELIGGQPATLLVRWRKLPAHYQLAAKLGGMAISAGIMLLAARRGLNTLQAIQRRNQPETESGFSLHSAN